jgi:hypothetical protein
VCVKRRERGGSVAVAAGRNSNNSNIKINTNSRHNHKLVPKSFNRLVAPMTITVDDDEEDDDEEDDDEEEEEEDKDDVNVEECSSPPSLLASPPPSNKLDIWINNSDNKRLALASSSPFSRDNPRLSISSKNNTQGAWSRADAKMAEMFFSDSPAHLLTYQDEQRRRKKRVTTRCIKETSSCHNLSYQHSWCDDQQRQLKIHGRMSCK